MPVDDVLIRVEGLRVRYGEAEALRGVSLEIRRNQVHAIIGPSGCGKSTLLRCLNRMHEVEGGVRTEGRILLDGEDVLGMVFQRPNPFPQMSVYENVLAGYRMNGVRLARAEADELVEAGLSMVGLWGEVKDRLRRRGSFLSGGQQQRLCIARALVMQPEVLLLDEPTSALDPIAAAGIENLVVGLAKTIAVVIVTHNIAQAGRVSDRTAFMYLGELVEYAPTKELFFNPRDERTERYIAGRFG